MKQRGAGCTCKQGASLGASNTVGSMDTLTTCFCSLLAHDFPLLLTTVVPYSARRYVHFGKLRKKWKKSNSEHLHLLTCFALIRQNINHVNISWW